MIKKFCLITVVILFSTIFTYEVFSKELTAKELAKKEKIANVCAMEITFEPVVINSILKQNELHANLTLEEVKVLDEQWRKETLAIKKPLIDKIRNNELSKFLRKVKEESKGLYTEIFIVDNKGLNVGMSDITSDYWQGDEEKWLETYKTNTKEAHLSKVEFDESSQTFQVQYSQTIFDGKTAVGSITIGLDAEKADAL